MPDWRIPAGYREYPSPADFRSRRDAHLRRIVDQFGLAEPIVPAGPRFRDSSTQVQVRFPQISQIPSPRTFCLVLVSYFQTLGQIVRFHSNFCFQGLLHFSDGRCIREYPCTSSRYDSAHMTQTTTGRLLPYFGGVDSILDFDTLYPGLHKVRVNPAAAVTDITYQCSFLQSGCRVPYAESFTSRHFAHHVETLGLSQHRTLSAVFERSHVEYQNRFVPFLPVFFSIGLENSIEPVLSMIWVSFRVLTF